MEKKPNYAIILTILITVTGWASTFGVCQNKIEQNTKDIGRVEAQLYTEVDKITTRQASTDSLLQSINSQLVELNTKMTLLLNGKISTDDKK